MHFTKRAMTETIKAHIEEVKAFQTDNKEQLEAFRIKYLGSKGLLKDFFAEFKNVPNEQKKEFGQVINELKTSAEEKVKSIQAETELKYLKAQFRPHFLFNTLNTIYFQIDEQNEAPRRTIEKLSELLRYQLYDVNHSVTVEQEFQFIETYMEVQRLRMKESLKLETFFDPALKPYHIQSLLLLPLVENAFKYVGGDYWIQIDARLEKGNRMTLEVRNSIPANTVNNSKKGIGLENLQRQLELLYAGKHKLQYIKSNGTYVAHMEIELVKKTTIG